MTLSKEIRRYALGLLYLIMAAFILGAVSYVASLIPEVEVSPGGGRGFELVSSKSGSIDFAIRVDVGLDEPITVGSDSIYIVAAYLHAGGFGIGGLGVANRSELIELQVREYNGSVVYGVVPGGTTFDRYFAYFHWGGPYELYLLKAPAGSDPVKVLDAFFESLQQPSQQPPVISSRLIVNFIGWVAGIALMVAALHKFGLFI